MIESVSDASFEQSSSINIDPSEEEYAMNAQGLVVDPSVVATLVKTEPAFSRTRSIEGTDGQTVPFAGQLIMSADDGSELLLTAVEEVSDPTDLFVDVSYRDRHGQTSTLSAQKLVDLPFYGVRLIQ